MLAKSVASTQVAEVLRRLRGTQASSQERTVSRFLANEGIDAQGLWQSFLPVLLAGWAKQPEMTLVVDTTRTRQLGDHRLVWHPVAFTGLASGLAGDARRPSVGRAPV
jgi:hypothetical protein